MTDDAALRREIARLIQGAPDSDGAYVRAADLLDGARTRALPELRLAILRSWTIEPLVEVLKVKCFLEGYRAELLLSEFNQYVQEIVDPNSRLYQFKPAVTFVTVRLEDLCPRLFSEYALLKPHEIQDLQSHIIQTIAKWVEHIAERSSTSILLSNFLTPAVGAQGLYDTQVSFGQIHVIRALNADVVRLRERFPQLYLFDLELLASRIGKDAFCDPLQLYRMTNPYCLSVYPAYGEYLMCHIRALRGSRRKCLVLDLDDTLWGGAVGEEGMGGVELSDAYPGNCFKDFQRAILQLAHRGVLLAINSKNNVEDGMAMLRSHPDMILREKHFSAIRINWNDKVDNLYEIARELNIGLDTLVVMDDSVVECERVRQACPDVLVVQLPAQRHAYRTTLERLGCFEQLSITAEDRARGESYRGQVERKHLASQAGSLQEFYQSLGMRGVLSRNLTVHIPRIAQMTQKTSQFNLTTRRYSEREIARLMEKGIVYSLQIEDQFGDNGVIAVAIVLPSTDGSEWTVDSLLMSCRVIMRTIEETLLAQIVEDGRAAGVARVIGQYIPTGKNQMVKDFYSQRGFAVHAITASGEAEYVLELAAGNALKPSPWIQLTREAELPR